MQMRGQRSFRFKAYSDFIVVGPLSWRCLLVELKRLLYNTGECLSERGGAHTCTHAHVHTLTLDKSSLCKQAHQMNQVVFLVCLLGQLLRSCQSCRLLTVRLKTGKESETEREKAPRCFCLCFSWSDRAVTLSFTDCRDNS